MAGEYDIVVIRAGPAGLCAARAADEYGTAIAMLDKFLSRQSKLTSTSKP